MVFYVFVAKIASALGLRHLWGWLEPQSRIDNYDNTLKLKNE